MGSQLHIFEADIQRDLSQSSLITFTEEKKKFALRFISIFFHASLIIYN